MKSGDILIRRSPAGGTGADSPTVGFNPSRVGGDWPRGTRSWREVFRETRALLWNREWRVRNGGAGAGHLPAQRRQDCGAVRHVLHLSVPHPSTAFVLLVHLL